MKLAETLQISYLEEHPIAAARSIETLSQAALNETLLSVDAQTLTPVLEYLSSTQAQRAFNQLEQKKQCEVLEQASPRLALMLLSALDEDMQSTLLESVDEVTRQDLSRLMNVDENSAGRLMERPFDTIREDMSVAHVLELLRNSPVSGARCVYVVDSEYRLVGRADLQALALADRTQVIADILSEPEGIARLDSDRAEIVSMLQSLGVDSIPVVDSNNRLMGIVRFQRLFQVIENVATADLQKMVGASADEKALSTAWFSVKRRLPWLHINLLTAFAAAAVVGLFEGLIAQFTALAVLLPVVAGQSGNAGSQALAVTIRGLALREIGLRDWRKVLDKEMRIGLINGIVLAFTCGLGVLVWSQSYGLALVIGVAMVLSMLAAGVSGALVPILLTRAGQDPATASSIILTTVTDIAGFFAFLGTAALLASML